ncbi:MAG: hypothetical protein IPN03_23055 [Holophagales bacterium]|nr:hypothetical protein [Holophagales bacterium]
MSLGGSPGAQRLTIRYNYGFLVYSLANPGAPAKISVEDLLGTDKYPKSGDGQERIGPVAISPDGTRVLGSWTDAAGYGTIVMNASGSSYYPVGDFLPTGDGVRALALLKVGARHLAFATSSQGIVASDITDYQTIAGPAHKNGIPSALIANAGISSPSGITALQAAGASIVVSWNSDALAVVDVSNPGPPGAGLTANFSGRGYTMSQLGLSASGSITAVAAASHPQSGDLYLLAEASTSLGGGIYASTGVTLNRVDPTTGGLTLVGSHLPPAGARRSQKQIVLLPFDSDVVAFFLEGRDSGGLQPEVHFSSYFSRNLAETAPAFSGPTQALSLKGLRVSGGNVFLYILDSVGSYVATLDCSTAPTPASAALSFEAVPYSGGAATPVADGGSVFIGDQLRIKPAFSPTDAIQPLLSWRLDYDFHDGNALDSNATTYRLKQPDSVLTAGATFPTQVTLIGPCDPAQVPQTGSAPEPSSGAGCWESVTTNGDWTVPAGTPDFSAAAPVDKQLTIGFEAQNALNEGSSSLAKHRIAWKVPRPFLKSTSILSGGALEDLSEGSPLTTGLSWYVSQVPVGQPGDDILTLQACTGTTCTPSPALVQPGNYRYWVTVPYRGGFRTAPCPGLQADQVTCSGDAAKVVSVTDVVLSLTAPAQVLVGTSTTTVSSTSKKAALATACPVSTNGFSYNFCVLSGGTALKGPTSRRA